MLERKARNTSAAHAGINCGLFLGVHHTKAKKGELNGCTKQCLDRTAGSTARACACAGEVLCLTSQRCVLQCQVVVYATQYTLVHWYYCWPTTDKGGVPIWRATPTTGAVFSTAWCHPNGTYLHGMVFGCKNMSDLGIHTRARLHACAYTHTHEQTSTHTHTYTRTRARTHTHTHHHHHHHHHHRHYSYYRFTTHDIRKHSLPLEFRQ